MAPSESLESEQRQASTAGRSTNHPNVAGRQHDLPRRRPRALRRWLSLGVCVAVIIGAVVVLVAVHKNNGVPSSVRGVAGTPPLPRPSARINLVSPGGSPNTAGLAEVIRRGKTAAIAIVGKGLAPNTKHNAYAIWLYNSPSDSVRLGFVNPGIGKSGRLETAGGLPANATRFKELLVTVETTANPTSPGRVVLKGSTSGL